MLDTLLAVPKQKIKFISFPPFFHNPWLAVSTGALHTNTFQGILLLLIFDFIVGLGIPITSDSLVQWQVNKHSSWE